MQPAADIENRRTSEPPIIEAVFEVTSQAARPTWTQEAAAGVVAAAGEFDGLKQIKQLFTVQTSLNLGPEPQMTATQQINDEMLVAFREDGAAATHVSPHLCTFNALRPYLGFDAYLPRLSKLFEAWANEVGTGGPYGASQRYINVIEVPADQPAAEWLSVVPRWPTSVAVPVGFTLQAIVPATGSCGIAVNVVLLGVVGAVQTWRLDLTALRPNQAAPMKTIDEVTAWHRDAHAVLRAWFRSSLTPAGRAQYPEIPS